MHVHHGTHWVVKLILPLATLSLSVVERLEAEWAGPPPPSEGHTWVGSELRDYRVEVGPNSFTADSQRHSQPAGPGLGHALFGLWVMQLEASLSMRAVAA